MVYHGQFKNGTIVLDEPAGLIEGTRVEVHVLSPPPKTEHSLRRHWLEFSGAIVDLPPDASQRVDEILYGRPDE
jgi:hypothetical protein